MSGIGLESEDFGLAARVGSRDLSDLYRRLTDRSCKSDTSDPVKQCESHTLLEGQAHSHHSMYLLQEAEQDPEFESSATACPTPNP